MYGMMYGTMARNGGKALFEESDLSCKTLLMGSAWTLLLHQWLGNLQKNFAAILGTLSYSTPDLKVLLVNHVVAGLLQYHVTRVRPLHKYHGVVLVGDCHQAMARTFHAAHRSSTSGHMIVVMTTERQAS